MYLRISDPEMISALGGAGVTNPRLGFSKQPVGLGFPHRAGRYSPGKPLTFSWFNGLYVYGSIDDAGIEGYPPRAALDQQTQG